MQRPPIVSMILVLIFFVSAQQANRINEDYDREQIVYVFDIKQDINPAAWRLTQRAFEEAQNINANYILIHLNTYGGMLNAADSIRTKILNSSIPVYVYIDNNAVSAGALISIAAKKIFMRKGSTIGSATVVDQGGNPLPDKYQSFMRSVMRSTAETHGKDTIIDGTDTIVRWHRDPLIAEAMVDPRTYIPGIIDTGKVLAFTTEEAMEHRYCEGVAENISEVLKLAGIENYTVVEFTPTTIDKIIGFLLNPFIHGLLIMIVIGGIYFEMQTPGVGFPIAAAGIAAILYFAPLYLEGIAQNWEILLFITGVVLIGLELFVIPGFGVAGFSGITLVIIGLTLSMVDNMVFEFDAGAAFREVIKALFIVLTSVFLSFILSIYASKQLFTRSIFGQLALNTIQDKEQGYLGVESSYKTLVGKTGSAHSDLRPAGKVIIEDEVYDATSLIGYIEKGTKVKVSRYEGGQVYVVIA